MEQAIFEGLDDELINWYFFNSSIIEKPFEDKIKDLRKKSVNSKGFIIESPKLQKEIQEIHDEMYKYIYKILSLKQNMFLEEILKSYPKEMTIYNINFIKLFKQRNDQDKLFPMQGI